MQPRLLAPDLCVTTQVTPGDIADAKAAGFRTIINDRPDGEEPGQPPSRDLAAAAEAAGLDYRHIPVLPGQYADAEIEAFGDALLACAKPALAFCKSGLRATSLWALSQADKRPVPEIVRQAAACGYDLLPLVPRLQSRNRPSAGRV